MPKAPSFDLLRRLDYLDNAPDAAPHRVALLRAAAGFQRLFSIRSQDAPGLVALGAEVDAGCIGVPDAPTGGVSGTGISLRQAFESCVGEGVEFISQFATVDDTVVSLTEQEALADAAPDLRALWDRLRPCRRDPAAERMDWTQAANLADGTPSWLPADLCLRRPLQARTLDAPWPLSTGCGAGADPLDATVHGLLELIERDAVALWLRGGVRPRWCHLGLACRAAGTAARECDANGGPGCSTSPATLACRSWWPLPATMMGLVCAVAMPAARPWRRRRRPH